MVVRSTLFDQPFGITMRPKGQVVVLGSQPLSVVRGFEVVEWLTGSVVGAIVSVVVAMHVTAAMYTLVL